MSVASLFMPRIFPRQTALVSDPWSLVFWSLVLYSSADAIPEL